VLHSYAVLLIEKKDQEGQSQVLSAALEVRFNDNVLMRNLVECMGFFPLHVEMDCIDFLFLFS